MRIKKWIAKILFGEGYNNSIVRDNWVREQLGKLASGKILDVGAGEQPYKKYCSHLEYVSQDFCQYDGNGDGKAAQVGEWITDNIDIRSDITDIPVENESFDYILCTEVFEHIISPEEAFRELTRILKKGGVIILTVPFCSMTHFAPYHYATGLNKYWYEAMAEKYGYKIVELQANGNFFEFMIAQLGWIEWAWNKYSSKKARKHYFLRIHIGILEKMLKRMSRETSDSCEFLTFGYHCVMKKEKGYV